VKASEFFSLPPSLAAFAPHFRGDAAPWEWLAGIAAALAGWKFDSPALFSKPAGLHVEGPVYLHPSVKLPPFGLIVGPVWIGPNTEIRPGALLRGNVIAGEGCVLGNSCEYKNCLLMDRVETAHFNYVGDSILGSRAHLGAGAICSNLRLDRGSVTVRLADRVVDTGLRKLGAILGEGAEVGCNAVLNPGTLLGPRSMVMPAIAFGGHLPAGAFAKGASGTTIVPRLSTP
jgi:UDP-N-acetylglucosamine diphosphorylase / glucose-1-phosphate thymidylyltransferase / UDP-N-acetylgalactosamine diphosphorylase / glucosamine-1-phosphate N-acetyltransferase / galactosamine-1-phosphate N-acetyltransferase